MAESHVVSGLIAKRSEMAGLIEHHQKAIARLAADLTHMDATIKLFCPDFDLRTVRAKAHRRRSPQFTPGECQRLVLEIFREACGAELSSRQIAERIIQHKGLESSMEVIEQMQKTVLGVLRRLENKLIQLTGKTGKAQFWRLIGEIA